MYPNFDLSISSTNYGFMTVAIIISCVLYKTFTNYNGLKITNTQLIARCFTGKILTPELSAVWTFTIFSVLLTDTGNKMHFLALLTLFIGAKITQLISNIY